MCRQLTECVIQYEELWEKKNIEFEADLEEKAIIYADESLMELVWNNLLSNAIKFTEDGGKINIKQITKGNKVIVSISDSGCGMRSETLSMKEFNVTGLCITEKHYMVDISNEKKMRISMSQMEG